MGNSKRNTADSRRQFFSLFLGNKNEKVQLLTAEGKLAEVDKSVVENAATKKKASNKEIYNWMKNPSKENK